MYTLGIDIGSTTSKCAVLKDGKELVARSLQTGGLGTGGPEEALAQLWQTSGLTRADMACAFVTGYGRKNYEGADGEISELTAHALGGRFVFPDLRTVIDIGGQDAKVIALSPSGKMVNFVMNDKCAAGTGRFLDVMASILRLDVDDLDAEAAKAAAPRRYLQHLHGVRRERGHQSVGQRRQAPRPGGGHLPQRGQPRGGSGPAGGRHGAGLSLRRRGPERRGAAGAQRRAERPRQCGPAGPVFRRHRRGPVGI